jgi:hypothetical protein
MTSREESTTVQSPIRTTSAAGRSLSLLIIPVTRVNAGLLERSIHHNRQRSNEPPDSAQTISAKRKNTEGGEY